MHYAYFRNWSIQVPPKFEKKINVFVVVLIVVAIHKGLVVVDKSLSDTH